MQDNLDRITTALEELVRLARVHVEYVTTVRQTPATAPVATAQQRADYHKEHAAELFGGALYNDAGRWREIGTGKPVVFTMYGWILEEDIR
jgi:hypothetical protein